MKNKKENTYDLNFPKILTAEMLSSFVTTDRGCTRPRVGTINARRYIAKCGAWSEYSSDEHVANELVADAFLRDAGFNVPKSKGYIVDFGGNIGSRVVRLAEYAEGTEPLGAVWEKADEELKRKIREKVMTAYGVQSFIAGIDTFTWDNVRVDARGELWFVDNGASFDFRACGLRKGWFWTRRRVDDPRVGFLSLARHRNQGFLRELLGGVDASGLWAMAHHCQFVGLIEKLPEKYATPELRRYAEALDCFAGNPMAYLPPSKTELVFVLDKSGSMCNVVSDTIGGFNAMIEKQKRENGICRVSTVLFDNNVEVLHNRVDIAKVEPITERDYVIGGSTALYDALGGAIKYHVNLQRRLPSTERADKVVFVVITDGYENSSHRFSRTALRRMIELEQKQWGWEFIFLGADIDAIEAAGEIGICAERAAKIRKDARGIASCYEGVSMAVSRVRNRRRLEDVDADGVTWRDFIDHADS